MNDEEGEIVAGLERDAAMHDLAADRLEEDARNRRKMAARARAGIDYFRAESNWRKAQ